MASCFQTHRWTTTGGGWGETEGGKCREAMLGGEVGRGDTRRLAMRRINVKIRRRKGEAEMKKNRDVAMTAATYLGPIRDKYIIRFPTRRQVTANSVPFFGFIKSETFLASFQFAFKWSFELVVNVRKEKRNQNVNIHLEEIGNIKNRCSILKSISVYQRI